MKNRIFQNLMKGELIMRKTYIPFISVIILSCILLMGANDNYIEVCPTKYIALAESAKVTGNPVGWVKLFEATDIDTACYKELRVYVHVMNDYYESKPFRSTSYFYIGAFHGIGRGSWSYYTSEDFRMEYTSGLDGFVEIPIIGDKTRIVVSAYDTPDVELEVDVAAYLVK